MQHINNNKLTLNEIVEIAKKMTQKSSLYQSLSTEEQARLTIGTSFSGNKARCRAYIPGERPELGLIISVWDIDRQSGIVTLISEEMEAK